MTATIAQLPKGTCAVLLLCAHVKSLRAVDACFKGRI